MKATIHQQLAQIEAQFQVKILYACESGSRAWGFESPDSDFDVRFIYVHPRDWYLQLDAERQRDVIELPIDNLLDINGWDLKKALNLFYKSNPVLLEWLSSPIVYRQDDDFVRAMRELMPVYFSAQKTFYHYLHMAKGNYREYLKGEQVRLKKYLYVLRPLLAIEWILQFAKPIPMRFSELVDACLPEQNVKEAVEHLLWVKTQRSEIAYGNAIPVLNAWIERKLAEFEAIRPDMIKTSSISALNTVFQQFCQERL
ncbi:nucleotidyltransferase domain-containing protein [Thiomicrorhabdus sp. 6S2-11]|uniref:Nucleotidyltransferase domain-containing protein n=1 Tax=Thiomicrorhabdus marina TaxID=2818442 RepID=A0ABS3Q748_9GAMM|nr:nucleotidyltransferase domain-containing protein [Thiomicrorhabdus marina]MBO1927774.1 nucleotidyltransferase domain-containing protein [Thiomicrorhabdus marina]